MPGLFAAITHNKQSGASLPRLSAKNQGADSDAPPLVITKNRRVSCRASAYGRTQIPSAPQISPGTVVPDCSVQSLWKDASSPVDVAEP
jgi:hypothetical protein